MTVQIPFKNVAIAILIVAVNTNSISWTVEVKHSGRSPISVILALTAISEVGTECCDGLPRVDGVEGGDVMFLIIAGGESNDSSFLTAIFRNRKLKNHV